MIYRFIYLIGEALRNPSMPGHFSFLKQSEKWSLEQLEHYQLSEVKIFLDFVYRYSPYYKKLFDQTSFKPTGITSITDIKKIPVLDKTTLLEHKKDIHTNYKFRKLFHAKTTGTSGQILTFRKDENWDSFNRASIMRGYSWYNVKPWERSGYLWGYNIALEKRWKVRLLDRLQNRIRLFSYEKENIEEFATKLSKANYLEGYSSMIYEIAKIINSTCRGTYNLKFVKGTSERILESYQNEVIRAFGKRMISEYGAAESGIIAFECPFGNMHINLEGVIVEEDKGEIIITNLLSRSFPIIRYKLGDYIELKPSSFKCSCGMSHPVISCIVGRVGRPLYGKTKIFPSAIIIYVFKNIASQNKVDLNYQAIQKKEGCLLIRIEQSVDDEALSLIQREMKQYFGADMDYTVIDKQDLQPKNSKKLDFISEVSSCD